MMKDSELVNLLNMLLDSSTETEWVEFKHNNAKPDDIGEYISALANSAALQLRDRAYLVWGIDNATHQVLGTNFQPHTNQIGNEELENWLCKLLDPNISFHFHSFLYKDLPVILLEIWPATHAPIRFKGQEFIRVGSYKKKLKDYLSKERDLWQKFQKITFESGIALSGLSAEKLMSVVNYRDFFQLLDQPLPENQSSILEKLEKEEIIIDHCGKYKITNLGAILIAQNLGDFGVLKRKIIRIITYKDVNRLQTIRERMFAKGYAVSFEPILE